MADLRQHPGRVAEAQARPTQDNLDECLARAEAESNKAGSGEMYYAWNHALHVLMGVRDLVAQHRRRTGVSDG